MAAASVRNKEENCLQQKTDDGNLFHPLKMFPQSRHGFLVQHAGGKMAGYGQSTT